VAQLRESTVITNITAPILLFFGYVFAGLDTPPVDDDHLGFSRTDIAPKGVQPPHG
jgi:hypothetical protein